MLFLKRYSFYSNQYFSKLIMQAVQAITATDIYRNRIPRDIAYLTFLTRLDLELELDLDLDFVIYARVVSKQPR